MGGALQLLLRPGGLPAATYSTLGAFSGAEGLCRSGRGVGLCHDPRFEARTSAVPARTPRSSGTTRPSSPSRTGLVRSTRSRAVASLSISTSRPLAGPKTPPAMPWPPCSWPGRSSSVSAARTTTTRPTKPSPLSFPTRPSARLASPSARISQTPRPSSAPATDCAISPVKPFRFCQTKSPLPPKSTSRASSRSTAPSPPSWRISSSPERSAPATSPRI